MKRLLLICAVLIGTACVPDVELCPKLPPRCSGTGADWEFPPAQRFAFVAGYHQACPVVGGCDAIP